MSKSIGIVAACVGMAWSVGNVCAQSPSTAQVWEVLFAVDNPGNASSSVEITIQARVGILPNTSASGTNNFGVARVGGASNVFFVRATEPIAALRPFHSMGRGFTREVDGSGQPRLDIHGEPLAGSFFQFRSGFAPAGPDSDNRTAFNGQFGLDATQRAFMTNVVGGRSDEYDGVPLGVASVGPGGVLTGDFANVYRFVYRPAPGPSRTVTFDVSGMSGRHIFFVGGGPASTTINLPNRSFTVQVPAPGAGGAAILLAGLGLRRRRTA